MSDSLMGELLCLTLLILVSGRVFFSGHRNSITITVLAPICLLISILQIIAQGCSISAFLILCLSFVSFITNLNALVRFFNKLYVDRYNPVFFIVSILILFLSVALTVVVVIYRETPVKPEKYGVEETYEVSKNGEKILWIYRPKNLVEKNSEKPVVLFSSDKRGDTKHYRPYLIFLAKAGYTVYSMDYYGKDISYFDSIFDLPFLRREAFVALSILKEDEFKQMKSITTKNILQEINDLLILAGKKENEKSKYFLVGDSMQLGAFESLMLNRDESICGYFFLTSIDLYQTPGYGCIPQTDPLLARLLNCNKEKSLLVPSYMASLTGKAIEKQTNEGEQK